MRNLLVLFAHIGKLLIIKQKELLVFSNMGESQNNCVITETEKSAHIYVISLLWKATNANQISICNFAVTDIISWMKTNTSYLTVLEAIKLTFLCSWAWFLLEAVIKHWFPPFFLVSDVLPAISGIPRE